MSKKFNNVEIFTDDNYYDAMNECLMGITNGGLTLVQALQFGLPTIALAQYEHQTKNIRLFPEGCVEGSLDNLGGLVSDLFANEYKRESLSRFARHYVDGKGVDRVCNLIEDLA
jgi:spore coat polysaccharide biosynthesis predicted glycosyltransferase SpsG